MRIRFRVGLLLVGILAAGPSVAEAQARVTSPTILALDPRDQWPADVQEGIAMFGVNPSSTRNFLKALARYPRALLGLSSLAGYIRGGSATAVDQALLALRVAWLCRSDAVWSEQAAEGRSVGPTAADLKRIAEGPDAGRGFRDATVLRAADELYSDSFLSDSTWAELAEQFNTRQTGDVIFTAPEDIMLSMIANSFEVQPDDHFGDRLPADVARKMQPARASRVRLDIAHVEPIPVAEWSVEQRKLLDPNSTGQATLNFFMTLVRYPALYRSRSCSRRISEPD